MRALPRPGTSRGTGSEVGAHNAVPDYVIVAWIRPRLELLINTKGIGNSETSVIVFRLHLAEVGEVGL